MDMPTRVGDEFLSALETRLVEATTASWEAWLGLLEEYKEANGNCNAPFKAGSLGRWVSHQRSAYNAKPQRITPERIARLEAIGFEWDPQAAAWEASFKELLAYKEANGNCNVPAQGSSLGRWVHHQRKAYNEKPQRLSPERIARLEEIGFEWDALAAAWEASFKELLAYKEAKGNCNAPRSSSLGVWVNTQRKAYKAKPQRITPERIDRLKAIGFEWDLRVRV